MPRKYKSAAHLTHENTKHRKGFDELRRYIDLTQAVVADRLDVTQEYVSQIERGEADVRLSTLSRYVEALVVLC